MGQIDLKGSSQTSLFPLPLFQVVEKTRKNGGMH
jgi:hypothetical protein